MEFTVEGDVEVRLGEWYPFCTNSNEYKMVSRIEIYFYKNVCLIFLDFVFDLYLREN